MESLKIQKHVSNHSAIYPDPDKNLNISYGGMEWPNAGFSLLESPLLAKNLLIPSHGCTPSPLMSYQISKKWSMSGS